MKTMRTILLVTAGLVMTLAVGAAQQSTPPAASPERVIEALKGNQPQPVLQPPGSSDSEPSMTAVLERYRRMMAAGEASPPAGASVRSATPPRQDPAFRSQRQSSEASTASASPASTPPVEASDETVEAIAQDLRSILARLESLARKSGGR